jgi:hypothetical protein
MIAQLVTSTLAFNGAAMRAPVRSSAVKMGFESALGAQAPLGLFDPLNLLKDADADRFDRLRYVEVKHGRICMLAVLGHIVTTAGIRLPGNIDFEGTSFASIPSGLKVIGRPISPASVPPCKTILPPCNMLPPLCNTRHCPCVTPARTRRRPRSSRSPASRRWSPSSAGSS